MLSVWRLYWYPAPPLCCLTTLRLGFCYWLSWSFATSRVILFPQYHCCMLQV